MNQVMDLASIDWNGLVYVFVCAAELYITGTKKGAERKEWVIDQFYHLLPDIVTQFITREQLDTLIENCVTRMKAHLAKS